MRKFENCKTFRVGTLQESIFGFVFSPEEEEQRGHRLLRALFRDLINLEIDKCQYTLRQASFLIESILNSNDANILTDRLGRKAKIDTVYEHLINSATGSIYNTPEANENHQIDNILDFHRNLIASTPVDISPMVRSCLRVMVKKDMENIISILLLN